MSQRPTRGFTLIELMVTLSVAGLLMFAVMPSMTGWMRDLRIRSAAESLQNGLQRARMEALRTNGPVSLWLVSDAYAASCAGSTTSSAWVIAASDPAGLCNTDTAGIVERSTTGTGGTRFTVASTASRVLFNGFGQLATPAGEAAVQKVVIDLSDTGARPLKIQVLSGGSIRMCDPNVGASDPRHCPTL